MKFGIASFALAVTLASAIATAAAPPPPARVRGVVTAIDDTQVVVQPKTGAPITIALAKEWRVSMTKPVKVDQIVPGSFIGTTEIPQADGSGRSLEVHVFPPGVKVGEGHYAWDLQPGSMMTNGTVGKVVAGANGRELQISYPNGQRKVTVPPNVPVVQIESAERNQVKVGIPVFLIAVSRADGTQVASSISIGENGAAPPM
jgi:hypothetical protein